MINIDRTMLGILGIVILVAVFIAIRAHRNPRGPIDLADLVLGHDGRISKSAVLLMSGYAFCLWLMGYLAVNDKMTEGYFTVFGGLAIAPFIAQLLKSEPAPEPPKE